MNLSIGLNYWRSPQINKEYDVSKNTPSNVLSLFIKMNDKELNKLKMGPKHPLFMKDQVSEISTDNQSWWQADLLTTKLVPEDYSNIKELATNLGFKIHSIQHLEYFEHEYEGVTVNLERLRVNINYCNTTSFISYPKEIEMVKYLKIAKLLSDDIGVDCLNTDNYTQRLIEAIGMWVSTNNRFGMLVGNRVDDYPVMPEAGYQRFLFEVNQSGDGFLRNPLKRFLSDDEKKLIGDEPLFKNCEFSVGVSLLESLGINTLKDLYVSGYGWVLLSPSIDDRL